MISHRENYLRTITFSRPEYIPCRVALSRALWNELGSELEEVLTHHPILFPNFKKGQGRRPVSDERHRVGRFVDSWGCVWENAIDGIVGVVTGHPLADWDALKGYKPPDPSRFDHLGRIDWEQRIAEIKARKERGQLTQANFAHGFLFMRLTYLRGFENFMLDIATNEPRLRELIKIVEEFNMYYVRRYLPLGVDIAHFGEDLGAQDAAMLSPAQFREWLAPSYRRLMQPFRESGTHVYLHSDGHIMELIDDLIDCGVNIINLQDLVNGIENIERHIKGRIAIELDIDRQKIVPFGKPSEIRALIEEEVKRLGSPDFRCASAFIRRRRRRMWMPCSRRWRSSAHTGGTRVDEKEMHNDRRGRLRAG